DLAKRRRQRRQQPQVTRRRGSGAACSRWPSPKACCSAVSDGDTGDAPAIQPHGAAAGVGHRTPTRPAQDQTDLLLLLPEGENIMLLRACPPMYEAIAFADAGVVHIFVCCSHDARFSLCDVRLQRIWQFWHWDFLAECIVSTIRRTQTIVRHS
uniref:Uncharacterized protein n=1 Tax=Aegilops tauschii subsp. strangulata TaxID=200361 RepID=A0A452YEE0_AEGTS